MEDGQSRIIKTWLLPKSVQNIQIFIRFANFYWCFIQKLQHDSRFIYFNTKDNKSSKILTLKASKLTDDEIVGGGSRLIQKLVKFKNPKSIRCIEELSFLDPDGQPNSDFTMKLRSLQFYKDDSN